MAFMFLPFLAVTVRRLHDVGKSGAWAWLLLLSYIGLGILSFFWLCKEGNKGLNKYGPNPKEPGVLFTPVYVTCIKGSIAGMRVSGINIYIGSDAGRCQLIFPEEEPYVSRCHCVVCSKNSGIELIDLDSRYGTFLSDGTRLTPNVPVILRSGESFFVGTSNSMISVFMQ